MFLSESSRRRRHFGGKHILVAGASSGIGRALALQLADSAARLSLVARTASTLEAAVSDIRAYGRDESTGAHDVIVAGYPCDCSDPEAVDTMITRAEEENGPIDILVNCTGGAHCDYFENLTPQLAESQMKTNYFSQMYPSRAVFAKMKQRGTGGQIVFTSSMAGLVGVFGYTAYSPAKWALRGLAECIYYEGRPHGIDVTVVYPPDTDTPGLANEKKTMPKESMEISGSAGLYTPENVAGVAVRAIVRRQARATVGLDGNMLGILTAGMTPGVSLLEVVVMPIMRAISGFFVADFNKIIDKHAKEAGVSTETTETNDTTGAS